MGGGPAPSHSHSMDNYWIVASPPLSGCHFLNELQEGPVVLGQSLLAPATHLVLRHLLLLVRLCDHTPERGEGCTERGRGKSIF